MSAWRSVNGSASLSQHDRTEAPKPRRGAVRRKRRRCYAKASGGQTDEPQHCLCLCATSGLYARGVNGKCGGTRDVSAAEAPALPLSLRHLWSLRQRRRREAWTEGLDGKCEGPRCGGLLDR